MPTNWLVDSTSEGPSSNNSIQFCKWPPLKNVTSAVAKTSGKSFQALEDIYKIKIVGNTIYGQSLD